MGTNGLGNLGKALLRVGEERGSRILGKGVLSQCSRAYYGREL